MKAKIQTRLEDNNKRSDLGNILPSDTPFVLMIDPSSACNHKCKFCPTGDIELIRSTNRYVGTLDFNCYKKIIDDIYNFAKPLKVLRLYKVGEPLVNKYFAEMIAYARKNPNIQKIETTTNGLLLSPLLNEKIISAGINQINISVNGVNEDKIYHYTRTKLDFKEYVKNIKHLYENKNDCEIYIKAIKQNLTVEEQKQFFDIFGNYADRIFLENISPAWPEYEFNDIPMQFEEGHYGQEIIERQVCPYLFYIMVINSDGEVSTCVQDWKQQMILGSTKENSLKDIWLGKSATEYRLNHLNGNKNLYQTCRNCLVMKYGVIDNIDSSSQIIKTKIIKGEYL